LIFHWFLVGFGGWWQPAASNVAQVRAGADSIIAKPLIFHWFLVGFSKLLIFHWFLTGFGGWWQPAASNLAQARFQ
jgi:hypothetical protein